MVVVYVAVGFVADYQDDYIGAAKRNNNNFDKISDVIDSNDKINNKNMLTPPGTHTSEPDVTLLQFKLFLYSWHLRQNWIPLGRYIFLLPQYKNLSDILLFRFVFFIHFFFALSTRIILQMFAV